MDDEYVPPAAIVRNRRSTL